MRMGVPTTLLVAAILAASPYQEAVASALADIQTVPTPSRQQVRYLLALTEDDLPAVSFVLASVSRTRVIRQPKIIGNGVLRIQLAWLYGSDSKAAKEILSAWEQLNEPYFTRDLAHQTLAASCQTAYPIMRADAFVAQVIGAEDSKDYYAFSGVPLRQSDFYKSLGFVLSETERVRAELEANIAISGVTDVPRRILHYRAPFGSIFVTQDTADEKLGNHPIVPADVPTGYKFRFEASEIFALKSNGFWLTALYNAAGERQAAVPGNIATDDFGGEILPAFSCYRCHEARGAAALQSFADDQVVIPNVGDRDEIQRLQDTHVPDRLQDDMTAAAVTYMKAVAVATAGMVRETRHVRAMTPQEATSAMVRVAEGYIGPVDRERAAVELSIDDAELTKRLETSRATAAVLLKAGKPVTRKTWEEAWPTLVR